MSITDVGTQILEIPALQRDFREGALYDARREQIDIGCSLWNTDDLNKIKTRRNDTPDYVMNTLDKLSEKLSGVHMSAPVQLSLLSGLIDTRESTVYDYVTQSKSTRGESSVQVKYFYKTGYKEMSMDQLTNIRYLDVAMTGNNNAATHFVIKIQYGAGAIFTFTKKCKSREEEGKDKSELKHCGEEIKSALAGKSSHNDETHRNASSSHTEIKCEFKCFGLTLCEANPTTFDEAVKFASNFRKIGEKLGVPCTVWLRPLVLLPECADAPKLHCDFNSEQASQWIKILEDCDATEIELKNALERTNKIVYDIVVAWILGWPLYLLTIGRLSLSGNVRNMRNDVGQKLEYVTKFRSESKTTLRKMIVEVRSGVKTIQDFNQKTNLFAGSLDDIRKSAKKQPSWFALLTTFRTTRVR